MYNYMYACSTRGIDAKVVSEECLHHKILLNIDLTIYHISIYITFLIWMVIICGRERVPFSLVLNKNFSFLVVSDP